MKVQIAQQQNIKKGPQFKGGADIALRFLATNQGVGANLTDLSFMVIPRVATDAKRGPDACLETTRREASGTFNHSMIGVYGGAAGAIIASLMGIKNKFDINPNSLFAAPETVNILAENKSKQIKNNLQQKDYLKETFSNLKVFRPTAENADKDGYVKLTKETVDDIANLFDNVLNDKNMNFKLWKKTKTSNSYHVAKNKLIGVTGEESKYILESADGKIKSVTSLENLLKDIYAVSEAFNKDKIKATFTEQVKNGKTIKENVFIQKFSKFMKSRALAGVAIGSLVGMSIQPINVYLTKLKTGTDGFVGVEGRSKDDSVGFKALKAGAAAAFGGLTMWSLGSGFKGLMDKMAFKGMLPTISQLKGIYGLTIISRLLAARDKDELRESLTKDTLGFLSWLVLGDVVNRITAESLDKSVMNRTKDVANKGFFTRIAKSTLKTRDEILIEALASKNIKTVKEEGGKVIAKTFNEMLKDLDKLPEELRKSTKKRLGTLNKAQLAGYAFSGLVLGLGIPNLNIYITNKLDKKRKAKLAEQQTQQPQLAKA